MRMLKDSSTAVTSRRKPLSRSQFEHICFRAARNSTNCDQYIQRVLTNLCRWLGIPDHFESLLPTEKGIGENTQLAVITLYHLLEKECRYDFDAAEVLNSCPDEPEGTYH